MRKTIGIGIIILCIVGGIYVGTFSRSTIQKSSGETVKAATIHRATPTVSSVSAPLTLSIPKIHVNAQVESVTTDSQGRMDVPKHVEDVGWYSLGYKPGETGSAVIDGHYDTVTGAPASFYNISQLNVGDEVDVTDAANKTRTFLVTQNVSYPYNGLPLQQIFHTTDKPRLNLITCHGTWDKASKNYSEREVVYAVLK